MKVFIHHIYISYDILNVSGVGSYGALFKEQNKAKLLVVAVYSIYSHSLRLKSK